MEGDTIYGGTVKAANLVAADLIEDRIFNPENHINMLGAQRGRLKLYIHIGRPGLLIVAKTAIFTFKTYC